MWKGCVRAHVCKTSLLLLSCRQQRLAEWKATQMKNKFGEVLEISGEDYVQEVTKAGEGLWVILHLYKQGWAIWCLRMYAHSLRRVWLCDPVGCSLQAPLSMGLPRQEYCSGLAFPSPGGLPDPGTRPARPVSPALSGVFFTSEPPGKPWCLSLNINLNLRLEHLRLTSHQRSFFLN